MTHHMATNTARSSRPGRSRSAIKLASRSQSRLLVSSKVAVSRHAPGIFPHASPPCWLIGNEHPGFVVVRLPHRAQVGVNGVLLPAQDVSEPRHACLAGLRDQSQSEEEKNR